MAKGISDGHWVDLEYAFSFGRGVPPSSTCQFQLDEDKGSRRDFILACPIALAAASMCSVLSDRWFTPHFAVCAEFTLSSWDAIVERARIHSPLWPACWLYCPDRSRSSPTSVVRDIWDVYIREVGFVPFEVRSNLFRLCHSSDVDSSWLLWSREAEACLSFAYLAAGGPPSQILVVMLDVVLFPFAPCVWAGAVMVVSIVLIVLMSLMLPILASF